MIREEYYGTGNISVYNFWNEAVGSGNTERSVVATKAKLLGMDVQNVGAAASYLHIYDLAAAPTCGGTPGSNDTALMSFMIPAGGGKVNEKNMALEFSNGISYAITSTPGDPTAEAQTGVTNANEVVVNFEYYAKF